MLRNATKAGKQLILCAKIRHRSSGIIQCDAVLCSSLLCYSSVCMCMNIEHIEQAGRQPYKYIPIRIIVYNFASASAIECVLVCARGTHHQRWLFVHIEYIRQGIGRYTNTVLYIYLCRTEMLSECIV